MSGTDATQGWTNFPTQDHGYAAWEEARAGADAGTQVVPVFIEADVSARRAKRLLDDFDANPNITLPDAEKDRVFSEALEEIDGPYRFFVFATRGAIAELSAMSKFRVDHIGGALPRGICGPQTQYSPNDLRPTQSVVPAIGAVIDDGIPYLNARFRSAETKTRFHAVWLQADQRAPDAQIGDLPGQPLSQADIETYLSYGSEAEHYQTMNRALLPITDRASTNARSSHGSHVTDTAYGAEIGAAANSLLAVQLPPAAVVDTSGRQNEAFVIMGLRWIMAQAMQRAHGAAPLVVTLSMGALGGPGDGTGFLADWMSHEAKMYERLTGVPMHIVCAYGNAHRSRLTARANVDQNTPLNLDWRVQPEDYSPSFLELRVKKGDAANLTVSVTPPEGSNVAPLSMDWAAMSQGHSCPSADRPIAAVFPLVEGATNAVAIALAPTASVQDERRLAPSGAWTVSVSTTGSTPVLVSAHVQRDDTPAGYRLMGRQSWLDHPGAWGWDEQTRDWIKPDEAANPVTRAGTAVAHASAAHPNIWMIGSVKPQIGAPNNRVSSLYSAEGIAPNSDRARMGDSPGPDYVTVADDGGNLYGRNASAVHSGSTVRLSGTSVAAPNFARALLVAIEVSTRTGKPVHDIFQEGAKPITPVDADIPALTGRGALRGQRPYTRSGHLDTTWMDPS